MILHLIQCEECESTHRIEPLLGPIHNQVPDTWFTLVKGNFQGNEGWNYCSKACLLKSLGGAHLQESQALPSKMRRFVLVDGETADETDGIKWSDGLVTCAPDKEAGTWQYRVWQSWDDFKAGNPGCGVAWVDPEEVSDAGT